MSSLTVQMEVCERYGAQPDVPADEDKLRIALGTLDQKPLNGLRHAAQTGTCGWFIWGRREIPIDDDAYSPLHVAHMAEYCPDAVKFLGLPPGWRFLTDGEHVDVWEDRTLLDV